MPKSVKQIGKKGQDAMNEVMEKASSAKPAPKPIPPATPKKATTGRRKY